MERKMTFEQIMRQMERERFFNGVRHMKPNRTEIHEDCE